MDKKECIAMILAGGHGKRLGSLTHYYSKPAIHFGGNHRIIDFTLNNCRNSEIDTIGILSQYFTTDLNEYISYTYDGREGNCGIYLLPSKNDESLYKGTADAVYRNFAFIDRFMPKHVLILSSDHVYNMDYKKLIEFHKEKDSDVTVSSIPVPMEEVSKFGILSIDKKGQVSGFEEKPRQPKSNLASMGIYVFKWSSLKKYLLEDSELKQSKHDFGKDILPKMLHVSKFYTYQFNGYWRDVGTVDKLWEAHMDQLNDPSKFRMEDSEWNAYDFHKKENTNFLSAKAVVSQSILSGKCSIHGHVKHSVLSNSVTVGKNTEVVNSVIMPNVYIGNNVKIYNTIIGPHTMIMDNVVIGSDYGSHFFVDRQVCNSDVSLVAPWMHIIEGMEIKKNSHISKEKLDNYYSSIMKRSNFKYEKVPYVNV